MAYDLIRWGICIGLVVVVSLVMILLTKKIGKSIITGATVALIVVGILFLYPVENLFYTFDSVESAYNYKHHEDLLTYCECDEGAICIAERDDGSFICYTLDKKGDGYKLPQTLNENIQNRSSEYGIFIIKKFDKQAIILTQIPNSSYGDIKFTNNGVGYYYIVVDTPVITEKLAVKNEKVSLI